MYRTGESLSLAHMSVGDGIIDIQCKVRFGFGTIDKQPLSEYRSIVIS